MGSGYHPGLRMALAAAAVTLIVPGWTTDIIGLLVLLAVIFINRALRKREPAVNG